LSSTNRGGKRSEADWYITPPWLIHRLLDEFELPYEDQTQKWQNLTGGRWFEPCAGDGEIIRAVNARRSDIRWSACELREEMRPHLTPLVREGDGDRLLMEDLLSLNLDDFGGKKFNVAITNPPFRIAMPVVKKCMELSKLTILLLRLNFWGSDDRQAFMSKFPPDTYVLPQRPMFTINKKGKPGVDSVEYAWMVWGSPESYIASPDHGMIRVLKKTPKEERKAWTEHLKRLHSGLAT
jgi:hypothetical protein